MSLSFWQELSSKEPYRLNITDMKKHMPYKNFK